MKASPSHTTLYCFSPPVMLATLIIELGLAAYALWRYKMAVVSRIIMGILACLAVFQLAEFFVCGGYGFSADTWSVVGYVAITLLPPLAVHLVSVITKGAYRAAVWGGYAAAAIIIGHILLTPGASQAVCGGNYVIFSLQGLWSFIFGAYYHGLIFLSLVMAIRWWHRGNRVSQEALRWYVLGVLSFLAPVAVVITIIPAAANGIPSIMCGFAILFALILALRILPLVGLRR